MVMTRAMVVLLVSLQLMQTGLAARLKASSKQSDVGDAYAVNKSEGPIVSTQGAVIANVYHVSKSFGMEVLNMVLFAGGAYHVAIEAFGYEVGYGASRYCNTYEEQMRPGTYQAPPKNDPQHTYYRSEPLGHVNMTKEQFKYVVRTVSAEWRGCDYDLLNHNCVSFAQALAHALLGEEADLPAWMSRLMNIGDTLSPALPVLGAMSFASSKSSEAVSWAGGKVIEGTVDGAEALGHLSQQASRDWQADRARARHEAMHRNYRVRGGS